MSGDNTTLTHQDERIFEFCWFRKRFVRYISNIRLSPGILDRYVRFQFSNISEEQAILNFSNISEEQAILVRYLRI